jgi:hypothetical protein
VKQIKIQKENGRKKEEREEDKKRNNFLKRINLLMHWKVTTRGRVILRFFRGLRQSI